VAANQLLMDVDTKLDIAAIAGCSRLHEGEVDETTKQPSRVCKEREFPAGILQGRFLHIASPQSSIDEILSSRLDLNTSAHAEPSI